MKISRLYLQQQGVTLVEALIGAAILAVALSMAASVLNKVQNQFKHSDAKVKSRLIAGSVSSMFFTQLGHFPPVSRGAESGFYVFCFTDKGVPTAIKRTASAFASGNENAYTIVFQADYLKPTGVCEQVISTPSKDKDADGNAMMVAHHIFEVRLRVSYDAATANQVGTIDIMSNQGGPVEVVYTESTKLAL